MNCHRLLLALLIIASPCDAAEKKAPAPPPSPFNQRWSITNFGTNNTGQTYNRGVYQRASSIAATDKIYVEFKVNGSIQGTTTKASGKVSASIHVRGTAPLKSVTVVRNEKDAKTFSSKRNTLTNWYVDADPPKGEARYYLRVVQADGNMAWSSLVWVTVE